MNAIENASAIKLLQAAGELFSSRHFNGVSIKEIAALSGVNSALISYYFGGKRNLYQSVLNQQADIFIELIDSINAKKLSPSDKLRSYVEGISAIQKHNPQRITLIYRELLTPSTFCDNFVKNRLYKIHRYVADIVAEGVADGSIKKDVQPTHAAFTIEAILIFFFLTHAQVRDIIQVAEGEENTYLDEALTSYLDSITN